MPIRAERRELYPKDWKAISLAIRERAGWRCEGSPSYPDCRAEHGRPHPVTGSIVVLTCAHLDHDPTNVGPANLRAWCQRCHNTYDNPHRAMNAAKTRQHRGQREGAERDAALTPDQRGTERG
jgi:hypothetical protein